MSEKWDMVCGIMITEQKEDCERIKTFQVDFLGWETEKWLPSMDFWGRRCVSFK